MPNEAELARNGLSFRHAFCNTAMCSPSRATLLTGRYPAAHGVTLTHTAADLRPDSRNTPAVVATMADLMRRPGTPRGRLARGFARGLFQAGPRSGNEPELPVELPNLATVLRAAGYEVAYKGKWHLSHPLGGEWSERDAERLESDYGFAGWEPPDAGENAKAENFGGGSAGPLGEGWDEVYTRQATEWLEREDLPEPFCLVVSLVNPHDVLGYPASFERGGYQVSEFRDLGIDLPPTADEDLRDKPGVHTLMQLGTTAYLGALRGRRAKLDYVNFYAYLHRLVDEKVGRVLAALGEAGDPGSLRSRTVVVRASDHGEMGLAHGGLRQKMFNGYEETIRVPLVISSPALFPRPAETDAFASLVDVLPTIAALAGADGAALADTEGADLTPVLAHHAHPDHERLRAGGVDLNRVAGHPSPAPATADDFHFSFDDHQAGTALQNVAGQPNRLRALRTARWKYGFYFDPSGGADPEHELYDLERDPDEARNLVDKVSGEPRDPAQVAVLAELRERLTAQMTAHETTPPPAARPQWAR